MTVVLGKRTRDERRTDASWRRDAWLQRMQHPTPAATIPDGPPPVPVVEIHAHAPGIHSGGMPLRSRGSRDQIGVYATRLEEQRLRRTMARRSSRPEDLMRAGSYGYLREVAPIGRGTAAHYRRLYPAKPMHLPPLPSMSKRLSPTVFATSVRRTIHRGHPVNLVGSFYEQLLALWQRPRMAAPRRMLVGSLLAFALVAGMAGTALGQGRYEVKDGDTLDSIAAAFGVDPEAIYRSSYMPDGYQVAPGQIIVIPDPGQSPEEAAQMAAAKEGTSPWVQGAYIVEYGDTINSIAATWSVDPGALMSFNNIADATELIPGTRLLIPWERDDSTGSASSATGPQVAVGVPDYTQSRNLSCEYAATHIATAAFGDGIPESTFIANVPQAANPHDGYRGNIDGWWGNTDDYGIYPEALLPTLNANGFVGEVMYTEGDTSPLTAQLDAGHPVVVWLAFWGNTRVTLTDEGTYSVFAGMHVVTAYGYDDGGVYVMDPAKGHSVYLDWSTFEQLWSVIDGMGMAVYPA